MKSPWIKRGLREGSAEIRSACEHARAVEWGDLDSYATAVAAVIAEIDRHDQVADSLARLRRDAWSDLFDVEMALNRPVAVDLRRYIEEKVAARVADAAAALKARGAA